MTDFYEILGVPREANPAMIKAKYRNLAKTHHPDVGGDRAKFEQIQRAYDILMDPDKRRLYDETGAVDEAPEGNPDAEAIQMIDRIVNIVLGGEENWKGSFLDEVRRVLDAAKLDTEGQISTLRKKMRTTERALKKLVRKPDAKSVIEAMLNRQIETLKAQIAGGEAYTGTLDRSLELLAGYTMPAEPMSPTVQIQFGQTGPGGFRRVNPFSNFTNGF